MVEFHQSDTSDCDDSDASSYIEPYEDVHIPDTELIKIGQFYKALPNCTPLTFGFVKVSQRYDKLRCPCSKLMKDWTRCNRLERIPEYLKVSKYKPRSILQYDSDKGRYCVYHNAIKVYLQQLYYDDEKMLRRCYIIELLILGTHKYKILIKRGNILIRMLP